MLKNISWTDYITAILIASFFYYLFVGLRHYSVEIRDLLSGKRNLKFNSFLSRRDNQYNEDIEQSQQEEMAGFENTPDYEFDEMEHLIERIKSVIADASRRKLIPMEFKQYLSMVLREYPSVRYSPIRPSVNELILSECHKYGTVTLNEDELDLLWKEAM
jgi:hypothetical protein